MIFVNFKSYKEATGENAIKLAVICETVAEQTKVQIIPVVQIVDLWRVKQHVSIPVWLEHVDEKEPGAQTGYTTVEAAMQAEAAGTILNHSEHPIDHEKLKMIVERAKRLDPTFQIMLLAPDTNVLMQNKALNPDFLCYEPPELIGSKTESVATKKADVIADGVQMAGDIPLIVGAGIKSKEDVVASLRRDAKGVLVASGVVLSEKPDEKLLELASAYKSY
ncbi:MAG: triose-phosphate isomerase [Candidatus Roizmanbacteria bacterium]|nr:triose-phosphate isomerase [Candidatus Roizmanbacteria bacterium]